MTTILEPTEDVIFDIIYHNKIKDFGYISKVKLDRKNSDYSKDKINFLSFEFETINDSTGMEIVDFVSMKVKNSKDNKELIQKYKDYKLTEVK
jgi:hypothetical protein